jgi:adenylate cyclase
VVGEGWLAGMPEHDLMRGFCEECRSIRIELSTAAAVIDTLHPVYEARAFLWRADGTQEEPLLEYGRTAEGETAADWQKSVFFHLLTTGTDEIRRCLGRGDPADFETLQEFKAEGETDYVAFLHRFAKDRIIGEMDCVFSQWTTRRPEGFCEEELSALRRLVPSLALAIKCASLARIAGTLVEVYLGRGAGERVLSGRISRGVAERINVVLWFSDLRGYTTIADTTSPDEIIPLLNEYAEAVISSIHKGGGDVLKLIGDGVLAVFNAAEPAESCRWALRAEVELRSRIETLNGNRSGNGVQYPLSTSGCTLATASSATSGATNDSTSLSSVPQ